MANDISLTPYQPRPMEVDPPPASTSSVASETMPKENGTEDSVIARLSLIQHLITHSNQEVQDEFYALSGARLPSPHQLRTMKATWKSETTSEYAKNELKKQSKWKLQWLAQMMQIAWNALSESEKNLYGEISSAMNIPKQGFFHSIFSTLRNLRRPPFVELLSQHPEFFQTIFSALHAHNVLCAAVAAGIIPNAITTQEVLLEEARRAALRLATDLLPIPHLSLIDKGMTSIPREIAYAGLQNRALIVQRLDEASYKAMFHDIGKWESDAAQYHHDCQEQPTHATQDWKRRSYFGSSDLIEKLSLDEFETAYICRDRVLHKVQGIMLTKMRYIHLHKKKDYDEYLKIVALAINPQNISSPWYVEGCETALISHLANDCLLRNLDGILVGDPDETEGFYKGLGFAHFNLNSDADDWMNKDESHSDQDVMGPRKSDMHFGMRIKAQNIETLFHEGKLRDPMKQTPP